MVSNLDNMRFTVIGMDFVAFKIEHGGIHRFLSKANT